VEKEEGTGLGHVSVLVCWPSSQGGTSTTSVVDASYIHFRSE
jgi:hypothetical protein